MMYATPNDLVAYLDPVPDNAEVLIRRASRLVNDAILTAVYDVDDEGMPTDQRIAEALVEATCEQVAAWDEAGETGTGAASEYGSVSIGSVTLSDRRGGGSQGGGSAAERLCPQARMILQQAGLTGHAPYTYPAVGY